MGKIVIKFCETCNKKLIKQQKRFCSCECKNMAHRKYKHSIKTLEKMSNSNKGKICSEEKKKKIGEALRGRKLSEKTKEKMKKAHLGKVPWIKGKVHTKETRKKMSESQKGRVSAMKGRVHTKETRKKMHENHPDISGKNHPMYGKRHTDETKMKMSEARRGKNHPLFGKHHSKESKRKMRLSRIKEIKDKNGTIFPNYNKEACEYFRKFDKDNDTQGRYAVYGGGEYFIEKLGYWPDYINFDMKLIMEWDEEYHKYQKDKDIQRQKEIQEYYPDFEFIRIREKLI